MPRLLSSGVVASALIAGLIVSATLAVMVGRPFYADGSYYLLTILTTGDFLHVAWTRSGATLITQAPLVAALRVGISDITWLARIYGAALYLPAILAFVVTTWLARRDPLLFIGNALVILVCYYPTSFFIMGEFHVLYAGFWCAFVLLVTGHADRATGSLAVFLIAIAIAVSYEISVLLCPLLMLAAGWRAPRTTSAMARCILFLAMVPLLVGIVVGSIGILVPRDASNTGLFAAALRATFRNTTLLSLIGLVILAGAASVLQSSLRWILAALLALACLGCAWHLAKIDSGPALGAAFDQRAQVVPVLLFAAGVCGLDAWWRTQRGSEHAWRFNPWPLLLPALLVMSFDMRDSLGWRGFLGGFCAVLTDPHETADAFPDQPIARRYGWAWTFPTMSLLLRDAGSSALVRNPDPQQWQPFDPNGPLPDLDRFKADGGLCRLAPVEPDRR